MTWSIELWDVMTRPWPIQDQEVQCVVTSPPYWGLRDYGATGQLGLEATPEEYVERMVQVFREVRRVLRKDGIVWLNLGDCYAGKSTEPHGVKGQFRNGDGSGGGMTSWTHRGQRTPNTVVSGLKRKDLVGVPWMVAFALRRDGWYLRSDVVWEKPNRMPESVRDRPTRAHEYLFLLSKRERYFYDGRAIRQPYAEDTLPRCSRRRNPGHKNDGGGRWSIHSAKKWNESAERMKFNRRPPRPTRDLIEDKQRGHGRRHQGFNERWDQMTKEEQQALGANCPTVWSIATEGFAEAHFATFPTKLAERCVLSGSRKGDLVLDPFAGSGTTVLVADRHGRRGLGLELNPRYVEMARKRIAADAPLFQAAPEEPPETNQIPMEVTDDEEG